MIIGDTFETGELKSEHFKINDSQFRQLEVNLSEFWFPYDLKFWKQLSANAREAPGS
jgi:hypothetical protein